MSSIIGDDLILLLNNLTFTIVKMWKNGKSHLKHWSGPISPKEMRRFLGLIILMGQVRKENIRDYWSIDPTLSTPIFPHTMSRNRFEMPGVPNGRPGILLTTDCIHRIQGGYSKFGPCMNILYRNLGQYTAQNQNCHLMKPWSHGGVTSNLGHTIQGK